MAKGFCGGCLCEKVRYTSSEDPVVTVHCCCTDCRKLGGTAHATHTVIPETAFQIDGQVSDYERVADSGNRINRRFCPTCGSAIFHTRDGMEGWVVLRTSSLDDPELVRPKRVIFTSSKVSWDHFDSQLPTFEEMSPPPKNPEPR